MLVEREDHLAALEAFRADAAAGRGAVVLVSGEAGIGKTTLLDAFRQRARQKAEFHWSGCDALFTPRPLGPLHELAYSFGPGVQRLLEEGEASAKLFAAIINELEQDKRQRIIVIEDVHWADYSTLDFLLYAGKRIALLSTMIIVSFRSDEVVGAHPMRKVIGELPPANVRRVDLELLTPDGVAALCAGGRFDSSAVYDVSGGNPFFVTELIAAGADRLGDIPQSVRDAVAARLSRLAPGEQHFLETIGVIPGVVRQDLLKPLFGDDGETFAMACVGRKLLLQDVNGGLRFRHELARLATIARTTATEQKANHRRILDAYEKLGLDPGIDQLVHHAAGALDAKRVLALAPVAARRAAAIGSHREAASHYATALEFVDEAEPELAASLYEGWAYEAGLADRIDDEVIEARRHALTLWRALGRPEKVGENLRWLSRLHWYRGESAKAQRFADEAVRTLETAGPSAEMAMAYSLRAQLHMLNDRMDEAVEWGEKAVALADEYGNIDAKVHALNNIGSALIFRGQTEGVAQMRESLALALDHGLHEHAARVYTNLSEYAVEFRDFALAEEVMTEGIAFDTRNDLVTWTNYLVGRFALLRMEQGRLRDAVTIARGALSLPTLTLLMRLPALTVLAKARLRMGESDAAALLAEALGDALAVDEAQYVVPARLGLLEAAWLAGEQDAANRELQQLFRIGADKMHNWNRGEVAVWAYRFGVTAPNSFAADISEPHKRELSGEAAGAAAAWLDIGAPYAAAVARLASPSPPDEATLAECIRVAATMESRAIDDKARAIAVEQGVAAAMPARRRGPYNAARHHPLGLTQKEQDVLRLMCEGENNVAIAERLSRSKKTIEHHASSIFRKMSVSSRMEAVLRIQSEPWLLPTDGDA